MNLVMCESGVTKLGFDPISGLPVSLKNARSDLEYLRNDRQPFFRLSCFRDGNELCLTAQDAVTAGIHKNGDGLSIYYNFLGEYDVCARCDVLPDEDGLLRFGIEVRQEGMEIAEIEYPVFELRDSLNGSDEDWMLLMHPFENGMLIHGFENGLTQVPRAFSDSPCCNPAQFAACGCATEQLYLATDDTLHHARQLLPVLRDGALNLSTRYFPDEPRAEAIVLPYSAHAGVLEEGEWYAAAEKFREWSNAQVWAEKRLDQRDDVPAWWLNSPVVLAIKERGKRNSELAQKPSPWCHPLEKGVPRIVELAKGMDSPVNVQVFHWEKGGGFVNGDHFPPLSGFDGTAKFFELLHEHGLTGGAYIIPHKWTFKAHVTGFDPSPFLFDKEVTKNAILHRDGKTAFSRPWDWEWRKRVCVCLAQETPRRELVNSFRAFSDMGADYIQFDTFCGVTPTCYNPAHHHPMGNGTWQVDNTLSILKEIRSFDKDFVLTFEAQPIPDILPLSHGFVERGLHPVNRRGVEMVPLYQFLYHPYVQGFAGENCGDFNTIDNFFYVNAITWVSGDLTMISLDMRGEVCMQTHEIDAYSQTVSDRFEESDILGFLRRINHLRRGAARKYLSEGEMLRAPRITCDSCGALEGRGFTREIPSVLGSAWRANDGSTGAVVVNHSDKEQEIGISLNVSAASARVTYDDDTTETLTLNNGCARLKLPSRGCALLEY